MCITTPVEIIVLYDKSRHTGNKFFCAFRANCNCKQPSPESRRSEEADEMVLCLNQIYSSIKLLWLGNVMSDEIKQYTNLSDEQCWQKFLLSCFDKSLKPVTHGLVGCDNCSRGYILAETVDSILNVIISVKLVIVLIGVQ